MHFSVNWSLNGESIPIGQVARIAGLSETFVRQSFREGNLGPGSGLGTSVEKLSLYSVASIFAAKEAREIQIPPNRIAELLPELAGAIYVHLALDEVRQGRFVHRGGTPSLNQQLHAALGRPDAKTHLEARLPGRSVTTKRYAWFDQEELFTADSLGEAPESPSLTYIDCWEIASTIRAGLRGDLFWTTIA